VNATANTNCVEIARFTTHYLVAADHPDPQRLRAKLDEAVVNALPRLITSLLNPLCPPTDERVWLIRRLHLDLGVNAAWDTDQVARVWGESLTHRLSAVMRAGADGEFALCFPNRATYLARFLIDCAGGWAWGKWYYEAFEGLRLLPTSAAIRTAVLDHSTTSLAALQYLSSADFRQVLSALTGHDARLLVEQLARAGAVCDDESVTRAVWDQLRRDRPEYSTRLEFWKAVLNLFVAVSRERPMMVGPTLMQSIKSVVRSAEKMEKSSHPDDVASAATSSQQDGAVRFTPFGGLFLLLPLLGTFPWEQATKGWPVCDGVPASTLLRFLVFVKCCGNMRAEQAIRDPLVRDLFRIPSAWSPAAIRTWQRHINGTPIAQLQRVSAEWQPAPMIDQRVYVLTCVRTVRSQSVAVLIEAMSGQWVWAEPLAARQRSTLAQWLAERSDQGHHKNDLFLYDIHLKQHVEGLMGWREIVPIPSERAQAAIGEDERLMKVASGTAMLSEECAYLALPKSCGLKPACDVALSATAQRILRSFAGRLPGFAGSGFDYLYRQFLNCPATMEEEPARRVVRLGPLPLQLILNMTGMSRSTYSLSWLGPRPIMTFPFEGNE
jgi:hypothetical protein